MLANRRGQLDLLFGVRLYLHRKYRSRGAELVHEIRTGVVRAVKSAAPALDRFSGTTVKKPDDPRPRYHVATPHPLYK